MKNSTHVDIVKLSDGREVCLSYGVIVAAFIPRGSTSEAWSELTRCKTLSPETCICPSMPCGYLRTDARYSVTTSRHMNHFAGKDSPTIPHAELIALCAPVASRL